MKKYSFFYATITLLFILFSCKTSQEENKESFKILSLTDIKIVNYTGLEPLLNIKDNKTYVVNFWATWCKPCVKELPAFEKLHVDLKSKNVEVLLVSMDFPDELQKELIPFIKNNNVKSPVVLLDDPDQNEWIPKVDEKWTGAIPATLIYNKASRKFYEQSFTYDELVKQVETFLN